jgi:D-serine deaminase-like pyridoxal phosphate-dependent protein
MSLYVSQHGDLAEYEYYRRALDGHALPAAFVDLDRFEANVARLSKRAGGLPIRLATKSIRSVHVIRTILDSCPAVQGLLCYSAAEAAWLAAEGFDDLVVAYPTSEIEHLVEVARQVRIGHRITLMVDCIEHIDRIDRVGKAENVVLPVAIDLDVSSRYPGLYFGMYRSPVTTADRAVALASQIRQRRGLRLDGLMAYEGQIAGVPDRVPRAFVMNALIRLLKRSSSAQVNDRRRRVVSALEAAGHVLRFVNGGGTGSLETTIRDTSVTEVAAGSGLYAPTLFDFYRNFSLAPAAGFALPVVRIPRAGIATCLGGGYIASGASGISRLPTPWLPAGCSLVTQEGAGEVQTPVRHSTSVELPIGAPIFFRHAKAGELCERFNTLLLIRDGRVVDEAQTYRGNGKSFF